MPRAQQPVAIAPPTQGIHVGIVEPQVPEGYLWKSQNMIPRFGIFRTRPGLQRSAPTGPGGRVTGGIFFKDNQNPPQTHVVAATTANLFQLAGNAYADITGPPTPLTGSADDQSRFAYFPSGGSNFVIMTNNHDLPRAWDGVAPTFSVLGGSPPIARDITTCFNRVLLANVVEGGIRSPSRVRISDFNNPASWSLGTGNLIDLTDSDDDLVGIRAITRTAAIAYKDNSLWIFTGQAGTFPFRVEVLEPARPGPMSPSAVVVAQGVHWYLGNDYRIYQVTPLGAQDVSSQADKELQARVRTTTKTRVWGVYRKLDQQVWWFFPGTGTDPDQAVSIDTHTGAIHFHQFSQALTAGWAGDSVAGIQWTDLLPFRWNTIAATYPSWASMGGTLVPTEFIGSVGGQVYRFLYDRDDDSTPIAMRWEMPPRSLAGPQKSTAFDAIENSFEQVTNGPLITVSVGVTNSLAEAAGPTYTPLSEPHDTTSTLKQTLAPLSPLAIEGQFMNVKFEATSSVPVKWKGSLLYAVPEEVAS